MSKTCLKFQVWCKDELWDSLSAFLIRAWNRLVESVWAYLRVHLK